MTNTDQTTLETRFTTKLNQLKREYQRGINRDLSQHQWQGMFARQLANCMGQLFNYSSQLHAQLLNPTQDGTLENTTTENCGANPGKNHSDQLTTLTAQTKETLIEFALHHNRSSCALSNFPDEHLPSGEYLASALAETERLWQQWLQQPTHEVTS